MSSAPMNGVESSRPLPMVRLLLVGAVVPAICVALDRLLLAGIIGRDSEGGLMVLTLAAFVVQVGLFGVLCGRWIEQPLLRWIIYIWCWALIDLQTLTTAALAGQSYYW